MQHLTLAILIFCCLQAGGCTSSKNEWEKISLTAAVKKGNLSKVSACLSRGEAPNFIDPYGTPVLHWACYCDKKGSIVKELLEAGARIDTRDKDGWIALDWAYKASNPSAIKQLIQKAIELKQLKIRGHDGKTLLHYAAALADEEGYKLIKQLLELSLNPNAQDAKGHIPLDYAQRKDVIVVLSLVTTNPIGLKS